VQVGEVADVVDEHRTAVAARRRPAVDAGREHEVVEDALAATREEIEQTGLAVRALEDVGLVDRDHRLPAALGGERVSRPGRFLLLGEELLVSHLPLGSDTIGGRFI
jgi:hypothetical protein